MTKDSPNPHVPDVWKEVKQVVSNVILQQDLSGIRIHPHLRRIASTLDLSVRIEAGRDMNIEHHIQILLQKLKHHMIHVGNSHRREFPCHPVTLTLSP